MLQLLSKSDRQKLLRIQTQQRSSPLYSGFNSGNVCKGCYFSFRSFKTADHKVICVRNPDSDLQFQYHIEIYSPKTGPWWRSGRPFAAPFNVDFKSSGFWNGSVHWISDFGDLLRFDVNEEQIRE
ncbi:hypothetical protein SLEP1_g28022 [Rubroshorea leprosula]|uniref:F-box protein n=1 Tax=Rubroshorea leprosula TaxID=152421 RepID=A0AAV5JXU7_9ROSI|nr:hypothetical protein SLEP1_g28022 [Rubroshorea leprosula]